MMRAHPRTVWRGLGQATLLAPAALAVHELRYLLAFGPNAGIELQRQGHNYLHSVVPWLALLLAILAGAFLRALGRAFSGRTSVSRLSISFVALWAACTGCLLAIYMTQEFLEGMAVTGHPAGWIGIFGYGGWWSIPAAVCVGLVVAAVYHACDWVLGEVSRRYQACVPVRRRPRQTPLRPRSRPLPRPAPVAGGWSGRGPPVLACT